MTRADPAKVESDVSASWQKQDTTHVCTWQRLLVCPFRLVGPTYIDHFLRNGLSFRVDSTVVCFVYPLFKGKVFSSY